MWKQARIQKGDTYPPPPQAKKVSNNNTHECEFKTLECVFNTHKSDFYKQSAIPHPLRVILHAECDFHTH
jgi:hypothetical protein